MTATAEIITSEEKNVLLVPNAALRFSPDKGSNARESSGVTSMIIPTRRRRSSGSREVGIGRGSQQTVYVLGADGQPKPIQVRVGDSNGSQTEVSGKDLQPGLKQHGRASGRENVWK